MGLGGTDSSHASRKFLRRFAVLALLLLAAPEGGSEHRLYDIHVVVELEPGTRSSEPP